MLREVLQVFSGQNIDLFSVGIAIASIGILGVTVFLNNHRSITNRTFFLFSLLTIAYGSFNYLNYHISSPLLILWLLRSTLFFAVWHAFSFFQLFYVFPAERTSFSFLYKFTLLPIVILTSLLTLTPFVFTRLTEVAGAGQVTNPERGPGIILFALVVALLVAGGIFLLLRGWHRSKGIERIQFRYIFFGTITMFSLIVAFNLILPVFFNELRLIPLAPVFIFPFVGFTSYAIIKHHLLNVKVIATEVLTFILAVVSLAEVVSANSLDVLMFRVVVFALVLSFSFLLIRSVRKEVEQREQLEVLTEQLGEANERLREIDRMKSQFYSFVSHQIKTPIGIIKGFTGLLIDGSYGVLPDHAKETIGKMRDAADRLITLVENFLDLRKIESGKMEYVFEEVDVVNMARKMVEELKPLAVRKSLELSFHSPAAKVLVRADVGRLTNVFQNLIDNAIKYTEKGWVRVEVEVSKNVRIVVSDSGRGMSKELLPTLFEQFNRDAKAAKTIAGTGLGLYLAKEIVKGHSGKVWAESDGEGKGSRFVVELPILAPVAAVAPGVKV